MSKDKEAVLLSAESICKTFGVSTGGILTKRRIIALEDVSLSVEKGRTMGLIGESGCGKTTLGRIIARLLFPDSGSVLLDGMDLCAPNADFDRHSIQMVFQDVGGALNPARRIGWMIDEALRAKGIDREGGASVIAAMLPRVGLDRDYLSRYPHELSGGQKQRVAILLAILMEPRLIVADEVVSSLDVSVRAQILNLMQELQRAMGISYLFISHDVSTVYYISHNISVMYLGGIVEQGSADDIYLRARHPYTRLLLGSQLSAADGIRAKTADSGEIPSRLQAGDCCRFAGRCASAKDICRKTKPPMTEVAEGHWVRCHACADL